MSDLTKRLLAMQAQLDAVLDVPPTPHFMRRQILNRMKLEACAEAVERIERDKPVVQITIGATMDTDDIREWIAAFFKHPERIEITRYEVNA